MDIRLTVREGPGLIGFACILLVLASPSTLEAQALSGRVLEMSSDRPVVAADVVLLDSSGSPVLQVSSDSSGAFRLEAPGTGRYQLRASRLGYSTGTTAPFDIVPPDTLDVIVRISIEPIEFAPLEITSGRSAMVIDPRLESWGYYDRRERFVTKGTGTAHFLDYETVKKRNPLRVTDLFHQLHGLRVVSRGGFNSPAVEGRRGCRLTFYLDGTKLRLPAMGGIDDYVIPGTIAAVEIYATAPYPAQYAGAASCGSIVIWTGFVEGKAVKRDGGNS